MSERAMSSSQRRRAKFLRPPVPADAPERPRLRALLDRATELPLCLVVAPAGYGKTVALAQWRTRHQGPVAWLTLDADDDSLAVLAPNIAAAIAVVDPESGQAIDEAWRRTSVPSPAAFAAILEAMLLADGPPLHLVLDDAHAAGDAFPAVLWSLVRQPIARLRLAVSGRVRPPMSLERLRLQGLVTEIGHDQLRLSRKEIERLAERRFYGAAADDLGGVLAEETGGWPAGVQMALRAVEGMVDAPEAAERIRAGSREVERYLVEEVLAQQPPDLQDFMVRTALVQEVTPNLAAVLLDGSEATERADRLFDDLLTRDLFVQPTPDGAGVRYLPFVRRALRVRSERTLSEAERRGLVRRAARWSADRGRIDDAVRLLLSVDAEEEAADVVEAAIGAAIAREEWTAPTAWLDHLPDRVVLARPMLLAAKAWIAQFSGRPQLALAIHAQLAEAIAARSFPAATADALQALAEVLRNGWFLPIEQDPAGAASRLDRAAHAIPPGERLGQSLAVCLRARALAAMGYEDEALVELVGWMEAQTGAIDAASARGQWMIALIHWQSGELRRWRDAAERFRSMARAGRLVIAEGWAENELGCVAYEQNRLDDAIAHLRAAREERGRRHSAQYASACALLALALDAVGGGDEADAILAEARTVLDEQRAFGLAKLMDSPAARLALTRGDDLQPHLDALATAGIDTVSFYSVTPPVLSRAMLLVARGTRAALTEARKLLGVVEERAVGCHHVVICLRVWALQALIHEASGQQASALKLARRSLEVGAAQGFRRTYLDLRPSFLPLTEQVARASPEIRGIDALLADLADAPGRRRPGSTPARIPGRDSPSLAIGVLTVREEQVLGALCRRMSYKEIGDRLSISPMTVKHHLTSIYAKFGVRSGREAIQHATERGWCADD